MCNRFVRTAEHRPKQCHHSAAVQTQCLGYITAPFLINYTRHMQCGYHSITVVSMRMCVCVGAGLYWIVKNPKLCNATNTNLIYITFRYRRSKFQCSRCLTLPYVCPVATSRGRMIFECVLRKENPVT